MSDKKDKLNIEKCRQEMSKRYKDEINNLKSEVKSLRVKNIELEDKVRAYESEMIVMKDWLERMQEYTNMSQEDLETIILNERIKGEVDKSLHRLFSGPFGSILKGCFGSLI